jgi:hypothetical protein
MNTQSSIFHTRSLYVIANISHYPLWQLAQVLISRQLYLVLPISSLIQKITVQPGGLRHLGMDIFGDSVHYA